MKRPDLVGKKADDWKRSAKARKRRRRRWKKRQAEKLAAMKPYRDLPRPPPHLANGRPSLWRGMVQLARYFGDPMEKYRTQLFQMVIVFFVLAGIRIAVAIASAARRPDCRPRLIANVIECTAITCEVLLADGTRGFCKPPVKPGDVVEVCKP